MLGNIFSITCDQAPWAYYGSTSHPLETTERTYEGLSILFEQWELVNDEF